MQQRSFQLAKILDTLVILHLFSMHLTTKLYMKIEM